jgi:1-pyrroline-5-carboxylate dehydrogenase
MSNGYFPIPRVENEPVQAYGPGSEEKLKLKLKIRELKSQVREIPMIIGGKTYYTEDKVSIHPPHEHAHLLGYWNRGNAEHIRLAIDEGLKARMAWETMAWEQRAAIFLKAADLLAGPYRALINASTMLAQSKNAYQAEIDAACEMIDFLRFNVQFMSQIYSDQPISSPGSWNRSEYRGLEGFVYAITPFNFTSIAGNLPISAALMGNVVVWKPSDKQIYSAQVLMEVFQKSGLPDGVINMIFADPIQASEIIFKHPDFTGLHFTGSTQVFRQIWKTIGENIDIYKTYPRIVGETGGKDFMLIHASADIEIAATALLRGAFEYQGQKCSAASRAYVSESIWPDLKALLQSQLAEMKMGTVENFQNFMNAVIDERSFDKLKSYIDRAKNHSESEIIWGGNCDKSIGYFVEPTVILTRNPHYETMIDELFGPVLTVFVYKEEDWEQTIQFIDRSTAYALTGGIIASDREVISELENKLRGAAGNFYINDKCTGAVVGQQPFGGARASGTNDKAGSYLNLLRWVSARSIKENLLPPTRYEYPFLLEE